MIKLLTLYHTIVQKEMLLERIQFGLVYDYFSIINPRSSRYYSAITQKLNSIIRFNEIKFQQKINLITGKLMYIHVPTLYQVNFSPPTKVNFFAQGNSISKICEIVNLEFALHIYLTFSHVKNNYNETATLSE